MNKYSIGFTIKLPIPGQQFSNIESRFDWEQETDLPLEKAIAQMEEQLKLLRSKADMVGADLQIHYKSLIEEQESKLAKAREEVIKLNNKNDGNIQNRPN